MAKRSSPQGPNTYRGWFFDEINGRLAAIYNGTEVFDFDADDLAIAQATTVAGGLTLTATDLEMTAGTLALNDGGTVTQATNKTTGVTLNTHTGQITMNGAALAAAAEATFTVTNSVVEAQSIVLVHHGSAGTSGAYLAQCTAVASGSFDITVSNVSAGSLSEAIVLHFAVLHGAAS